jgi:hypothetical protein
MSSTDTFEFLASRQTFQLLDDHPNLLNACMLSDAHADVILSEDKASPNILKLVSKKIMPKISQLSDQCK